MRQLEVSAAFNLDDLVPIERLPPPAPGTGQVLVRMRAVALNYRDLLVATGYDRWRPPAGRIPGSDGVGTVVEVGPGVTRFRVGDRVMTTILPNWVSGPLTVAKRSGALGGPSANGVLAELVLLDAEGVVHAPDYLTDAQVGNQNHFQANRAAPIFDEIRGIILKTTGLAEPIRAALSQVHEPIKVALIYGSVAKRTDTASSDVDLLIVSERLSLEDADAALAPAEQAISRKINITLLTPEEFQQRHTDNSPFLTKVLSGQHILLVGEVFW
jgi:predicted nucleotidyltransferase